VKKPFRTLTAFFVLLALLLPFKAVQARVSNLPPLQEPFSTPTLSPPPTPADIITAVNDLRLSHGLNVLAVHPVLMEVAAQQANALAASEGAVGHERPCGMTLGQQLLLMGYPLWGDLSMDGYRSENWVTASSAEDAISAWLSDDEHTNTMLSPNRSDIGAAVAVNNQIYVVLETALKTNSGQHQSTAYDILTGIPMTQTLCAGFTSGEISNYSIPVKISTARPDGDVVHEVKYGQTLWNLADQYKVSVEQIKRLNNLTEDTIILGWKLLIQKGATQPAPVTVAPPRLNVTGTSYPTAIPYFTATPTPTVISTTVPLSQQIKQNSTVVAALLISFSVLLAGLIGWGRRKE
jgi:LysM repeat protein